jgi:small-conductance mechanosensitive channel
MMELQTILQEWLSSFLMFLPKLIAGLVLFILFLVGSGFLAKAVKSVIAQRIKSEEVQNLIKQIVQWTIVIIGTVVALDQVDFNVTGFVAGLGIVGFTIGFALQDIARNFISGLILLYRQPFTIGEIIEVSGYTGTVKMINIRDTEIQTLDGDLVIIPNKAVFENPIVNRSAERLKRRTVAIGLAYEEDVDRAVDVFLGAIQAVNGVESEPEPTIQAMSMDDSTLGLTAFYWVDQKENNLLGVHSEVLKAVNRASHEHHINLPYPIQTVLVQQSNRNSVDVD